MSDPVSDLARGPRRKLPIFAGLALVVVLVGVWLVAFSSVMGVRSVAVSGMHRLSADEIRAAAAVGRGTPLIRLDTGAVRRRVEALPEVADARVSVSYPSTVRISVTERLPVGYLVKGAGFVLVDSSGTQYREVTGQPAGLPRFALPVTVDATNATNGTNGTNGTSGADVVASGHAVAIVAGALPAPVLAKLAEVSANSPDSITLVLRDGRIVTWGSADRSDQKARLLPALLTRPGTRFDVSNPDLVVAR